MESSFRTQCRVLLVGPRMALMHAFFATRGYNVEAAASGAAALAAMRAAPRHLLVVELELADMLFAEILSVVKREALAGAIVLVEDPAKSGLVVSMLTRGIDAYVPMPPEETFLLRVVERQLLAQLPRGEPLAGAQADAMRGLQGALHVERGRVAALTAEIDVLRAELNALRAHAPRSTEGAPSPLSTTPKAAVEQSPSEAAHAIPPAHAVSAPRDRTFAASRMEQFDLEAMGGLENADAVIEIESKIIAVSQVPYETRHVELEESEAPSAALELDEGYKTTSSHRQANLQIDLNPEIESLKQQLDPLLRRGLAERLKSAEWYLTGVQVGLESLFCFYEIADLVYRDQSVQTEGGRRVARLKTVYEALHRFATTEAIPDRIAVMMAAHAQLVLLLRDLEPAETGQRSRRRFIAQLANDVHLAFLRIRTFEQLKADLAELTSVRVRMFGGEALREEIIKRYGALLALLSVGDAASLANPEVRSALEKAVDRERGAVLRRLALLHAQFYRGRFKDHATGDVTVDFDESKLVPLLMKIVKEGLDYLARASTMYDHALELIGGPREVLARLGEVIFLQEEHELRRMAAP